MKDKTNFDISAFNRDMLAFVNHPVKRVLSISSVKTVEDQFFIRNLLMKLSEEECLNLEAMDQRSVRNRTNTKFFVFDLPEDD